jgi:hypothetical protein
MKLRRIIGTLALILFMNSLAEERTYFSARRRGPQFIPPPPPPPASIYGNQVEHAIAI